jgi:hypothetical protein
VELLAGWLLWRLHGVMILHAQKGSNMEVDKQFLQNMVYMLDSLIEMTRDKLVWQGLAVPFLGESWKEKFNAARADPHFLGEWELCVAEIQKMRDGLVKVLDQLQKGDPIQPPTDRIN